MPEYTVISRRILTGTVSDLPHAARLAWIAVLFEAEKLRGRVKLPVRDLAKMASISTPEAAEALRLFQAPDVYSSTKAYEGRRLLPIDGEEDWYTVTTWEEHTRERASFFNRLRQQRARERVSRGVTASNGESREVTKEPEPELELEPGKESKPGAAKSAARSPRKKTGSPMTEDWTPSPELVEAMQTECPAVDVRRQIPQFRDYWIGEGKPKADWSATFRNWIRRADGYRRGSDRRPEAPAGKPEQGRIDNIREMAREIKADLRLPDWNRCECTREQAEEWLASIAVDGCLVPDAPTLTDFLTRGDA